MKRRIIVRHQDIQDIQEVKEVKRRKIFSEDKLDTNDIANILCDMKNKPYNIIMKSARIKYIETIINIPSQDELPQL